MPDMNTALHAQEPKDVSSRWYHQESMADRKRLKVWLHFSKCEADYARCNFCDRKCKTSIRNTSSLVKHQIKAEEAQFSSASDLRFQLLHSAPLAHLNSLATRFLASNMRKEMFETTEMLEYKQLDVLLICSLKVIYMYCTDQKFGHTFSFKELSLFS
ncbi:hypothetical protein CHARACLAT_032674 [Characodon lateralis]|uniref:BED-type domain-containing protein n=1 Tax=Characodon lateralis TaxID=208331 RepID=A0ABU7CTQ6_9TELE|nr:hypothetical protein [Characodon lateralis]